MKEFDRLGLTVDAPEVLEKRTPLSKTFDLGGGKFHLRTANSLLHYDNNGVLDDIDLEPVDTGDFLVVDKAPYILHIGKFTPVIRYKGRASGIEIEMLLEHVDGIPPQLTLDGLVYRGIPDNDICINIKAHCVSTEQHIKSEAGIKTLGWKIKQNTPTPIVVEPMRTASDKEKNKAEVFINRTPLVRNGDAWEHVFEERITGKRLDKDRKTRKLTATDGLIFPVRVG